MTVTVVRLLFICSAAGFLVCYYPCICLFTLFMGFLRQEYWSGLPFPSPVDHVLSELSTMTHPSWVALHIMAHSFTELDKVVVHLIRLVSFLWWWFSVCLPSDGEGWGLWKLPDGRDWLRGKLGLVLMGGALLSKSLIWFCNLYFLYWVFLGRVGGGGVYSFLCVF